MSTLTIRDFTKLDFSEKVQLLHHSARLIDSYMDKTNLIDVYALNDFFVETTIEPSTGQVLDIIPYRRGFLMDKSYLYNHLRQNILSYIRMT